jgi:hypothetical protein
MAALHLGHLGVVMAGPEVGPGVSCGSWASVCASRIIASNASPWMSSRLLADRIEHVSKTKGDGAGFDILSFETDGRERFIEVKTTAYIAETPFYLSRNELSFSTEEAAKFHLYRLFNFRKQPRMFTLKGALDANCRLDPVSYRAEVMARESRAIVGAL